MNATLQVLLALPGFVERLERSCNGNTNLPKPVELLNAIAMARKDGNYELVQEALK